jgi:hypothetical protein
MNVNAYPRTFQPATDQPLPTVLSLPTVAAALSGVAAAIHAWVIPEHLEEWWGYGAFFLALTVAQLLYAVLILRSRRPAILVLGLVGTLATLTLYAWSRLVAVPLGPMAGEVEEVGRLDTLCNVVEVALVLILLALLVRTLTSRRGAA